MSQSIHKQLRLLAAEENKKQLTQDEQDAETLLKTVSDATVEFEDDDDDSVIEIVEYD